MTDHAPEEHDEDFFEPAAWEQRYAGTDQHWSDAPNTQLVAVLTGVGPGTALDVGCGEGGDVVWLAQQGWRVTGADFSSNGLRRAARTVERAGVAALVDWWQVDARDLSPAGRSWDLVTTHFLHPPDERILDVTRRLAGAVTPGGHLLIVGHAPSEFFTRLSAAQRNAMWRAEDLLPALPADFEALTVEQRPRTMTHDGQPHEVDDSTMLARRRP